MSVRKSHEQFIKEFMERGNSNVEILGQYYSQKHKIPVRCKVCDYRWDAWPDSLLRGSGCKKCAGALKKTTEQFIKEMQFVDETIIVTGEYRGNKAHIEVECKECGHKWTAMPINLLHGYGCPNCKGGVKQNNEQFLKRLKRTHPDIKACGKYVNSTTPIEFKCSRCGNTWKTTPNTVLNGQKSGCPYCAHNQTSFVEQLILEVCKSVYGENNVISRTRELIDSELDIVVKGEDGNILFAIEPGSWTLHYDKIDKDWKKIQLCKDKNIDLLIIYDQTGNECKLEESPHLWLYKKTFNRANDEDLLKLLKRLSVRFNFSFDENEFKRLKESAYAHSRRMSTKDFKDKLKLINPNLEVLSDYNGSQKKVRVHCKICDYYWETIPQLLLSGTGCPKCKKVPRKDTNYFINEMATINPNIEILGEYKNAKTKIEVACKVCGHKWFAIPDKLHSGRGCPECTKAQRSLNKIHTSRQG